MSRRLPEDKRARIITLTMHPDVIEKVDKAAAEQHFSRSTIVFARWRWASAYD